LLRRGNPSVPVLWYGSPTGEYVGSEYVIIFEPTDLPVGAWNFQKDLPVGETKKKHRPNFCDSPISFANFACNFNLNTFMTELKKIWKEEYLVHWYDTDLNGHIKMSAIANYLQESAWRHANHLGFGFEDAKKRNEFWVIVNLMIRMTGFPEWGKTITVETWPKGIDRLFAIRDFRILKNDGTVIGAATSSWMILDQDTRRPKNVDIVKPVLHLATHGDILMENAPFLPALKEISANELRKVRFSEVDQHGHVNNIRYIDWCLDALPAEWHRERRIKSMVINYLAEVRGDETIKISCGPDSDQFAFIQGNKEDDGKAIFRTRLDWGTM
jgi:medium-chain acyl-[acyl-carrier-protein] hydrolase